MPSTLTPPRAGRSSSSAAAAVVSARHGAGSNTGLVAVAASGKTESADSEGPWLVATWPVLAGRTAARHQVKLG